MSSLLGNQIIRGKFRTARAASNPLGASVMRVVDRVLGARFAKWYEDKLYKDLKKLGLRYEDLWFAGNMSGSYNKYAAACYRDLSDEKFNNRQFRLYRAQILDAQHKELPKEIQDLMTKEECFASELMLPRDYVDEELAELQAYENPMITSSRFY